MNLTIHRGTHQIGGCITEIESDGYKVFIDFGEQLQGAEGEELNPIDGLTVGDVSRSALFITHYHGDHIGSICDTVEELPIYVGKTALEIFKCVESRLSHIHDVAVSEKHKRMVERIKTINNFEILQKVEVGGIVVTPLWVDHSAFDAYMFVIEANGKRVLHTGDFRGHGFRSKGLIGILKKYAANIDYLIIEGTNIVEPDVVMKTERELQEEFLIEFKKYKYNFVLQSSTNIDRIFALYHASKNVGRCFVCDDYQMDIMKIVSNNHKEHSKFYDVDYEQAINYEGRFFVLKRKGNKPLTFVGKLKLYLEKHGFCMLIRSTDAFKSLVEEYARMPDSKVYYSMWWGYLDNKNAAFNESLHSFLRPYSLEYMHTSGHADFETIRNVIMTVNPNRGVIPIHTTLPSKFHELLGDIANIMVLNDGEELILKN